MRKVILSLVVLMGACVCACAQKETKRSAPEGTNVLVAYFSATGNTADAARKLADVTGGKLYEIVPEKAYTSEDLDWRDEKSRCYVEMHNLSFRPALKEKTVDVSGYDTVYIGFPIWWNLAPTIVNTFIESAGLQGKIVIPFATSGGSSIGNSVSELKRAYPGVDWKDGRLLNRADETAIRQWIASIK